MPSQKPILKKKGEKFLRKFVWIERTIIEPLSRQLENLNLFNILEKLGFLAAVIIFVLEMSDRKEKTIFEAWDAVKNAQGTESRVMKVALERLHREGFSLSGIDASGADLRETDFEKANFAYSKFNKSYLSNSNLAQAILSNAELQGAELYRTDLSHTNLANAKFKEAQLPEANLAGARISNTSFEGANLSLVSFCWPGRNSIPHALIQRWNYDFLPLICTYGINDSSFRLARVAGVEFQGFSFQLVTFQEAGLSDTDFKSARLWQVSFQAARLQDVNFQGATLQFVDFRDAQLSRVNFQGAKLADVNFQGTKFCHTIMPDGTENNSHCPLKLKSIGIETVPD